MSVFAAVMTGKGTGAISTIAVFGDSSETVIKKIFKPAGGKPATLKAGKVLLGTVTNGAETIDKVTIGCEERNNFAINCHGNPLIVADVMQLLEKRGAKLITAEQMLAKTLTAQKAINTIALEAKLTQPKAKTIIALEAKLTQPKAKTIEGTKIILNQIESGLCKKAEEWLQEINTMSLDETMAEAGRILRDSRTAKLIVTGCTAVITGPANSGKSTLLNCLCGKRKAIVTDIKGTTRDWVSARCRIGPLSVELIDTAGLDEKLTLTQESAVEKASQQKAVEVLENADLVLLVLDNSQATDQLDGLLPGKIAGKKVLTVLNKSDLPIRFDASRLPQMLANTVRISAKLGMGIESLLKKIPQIVGAADFDLKAAVCFTSRQEKLLRKLQKAKSKREAAAIITDLLNGQV
jgi:tRNA modification GTPase